MVIEGHDANYTTVNIEETVYEPEQHYNVFRDYVSEDAIEEKRINTYMNMAIYLPDYCQFPDPAKVNRDDFEILLSDARHGGNKSRMKPVNNFLHKFIQFFEVYDRKGDR